MKTKFVTRNVFATTIVFCLFVIIVVFKLNDYYKNEKSQIFKNQMLQQNSNLKSSISAQLGQLKNTLSAYMYQIEESKINWVQLESMSVLAQTHVSKNGEISVKSIFTKSGSKSERWTKDFLQKALNIHKFSKSAIHVGLFQTKSADKYIAVTYLQDGVNPTSETDAITVVAEASYFQKAFDLNRSRKVTHVLLNDSNTVAGHSESEYVATVSSENKINSDRYFLESEGLRSTNLKIISYSPKTAVVSFLNIPVMLLGLILGFACVLVGILFYAFRPIDKTLQEQKETDRQQLYKKALDANLQTAQASKPAKPPALPASNQSAPLTAEDNSVQVQNYSQLLEMMQMPQANPHQNPKVAAPEAVSQNAQENALPADFSFQSAASDIHAPTTLNVLLEDVLFHMQYLFSMSGVKLQQDLKSEQKFVVDPSRFKKLFQNILNNAIEAMQNTKVKQIQIRSFDRDGNAFVEIQDSGCGISPDNLEKVWHPYFSTKEKSKHQGLGLSEVQSIARRNGGDLNIASVPTGGTLVQLVMNGQNVDIEKEESTVATMQPDIDLDQILNLDQDVDTQDLDVKKDQMKAPINLEKEFSTTQFKIDRQLQVVEDPDIQINKSDKPMDQFQVRIRGPQKS